MAEQRGDVLIDRLCAIQNQAEESGAIAYKLLQEVFHGFPVEKLVRLLRSDSTTAVEAGSWLVAELGEKSVSLVSELPALLDNPSRKVRYWAIDAVHASATNQDGPLIAKAFRLIEDSDLVVRRAALYFLAWAGQEQLSASVPYLDARKLADLTTWLAGLKSSSRDLQDVLKRLDSADRLVRIFATAGASRIAGYDRSALERAAASDDDEVSVFVGRELMSSRPRLA